MNKVDVTLLYPNEQEVVHMIEILHTCWEYAKSNRPIDELIRSVQIIDENDDFMNAKPMLSVIDKSNPSLDVIGRFTEILKQRLPLTWFQNFIFAIGGVSRAFMDQLDRHQMPKYWEQSFRVLDLTTFATRGAYWHPEWLSGAEGEPRVGEIDVYRVAKMINNGEFSDSDLSWKKALAQDLYNRKFQIDQEVYNALVKLGMPTEQARGVIGLHTNTRTTMVCSWDALRHMISARTCFIAQGEYWRPVIAGMISELHRVGFPEDLIESLVKPPCMQSGSCPYEGNMLERLKDDPNDVCPLWIAEKMPDSFIYSRTVNTGDMLGTETRTHQEKYSLVQKDLVDFSIKKNPNYREVASQYGKALGKDLVQILGIDNAQKLA